MKRRILCLFLCFALACGILSGITAAGFEDTQGHWAQSYIDRATSLGLFAGITEEEFAPDLLMTRGMFVTALGRYAGINTAQWCDCTYLLRLFTDVDTESYYAPYVNWAVRMGYAKGTSSTTFSPDTEITREQMACLLYNFLTAEGYPLQTRLPSIRNIYSAFVNNEPVEAAPISALFFADAADIHDWAAVSVDTLQYSGLIEGVSIGHNTYSFLPLKPASRAECAVVFCRMYDEFSTAELPEKITATSVVLNQDIVEVMEGCTVSLFATILPEAVTNTNVIWYSIDNSLASIDSNGVITGNSPGTTLIYAMTANGLTAYCQVDCVPYEAPVSLSEAEKQILIFGEEVSNPRSVYATEEEALQHMATVRVRTWDIDESGEKYTRTWALTVHESLADTMSALFEEIYQLPEQVPIHSLGGYRWADINSEHSPGLAVDINPAENYYCRPDETPIVGKYFKPGEDPYSIPVEGEVDRIFSKYGFTRGIYWRSGYKDYMHYSFFGT